MTMGDMVSGRGNAPAGSRANKNNKRARPWLASYPASVDWHMRIYGESLVHGFDRAVARHGPLPVTDFFGQRMTYQQLGKLVARAASGLQQQLGVGKGTRVGLLLPNSPSYIIMFFAVLKAGGTVVNCNPLYTEHELAFQVEDSGAEIMVTHDLQSLFPKVEKLLRKGALRGAVICRFKDLLPPFKRLMFTVFKAGMIADIKGSDVARKITPFERLIDNKGRLEEVVIDPDQDIAVLQYTGGTTGRPKAAMLSHANISANLQQVTAWASEIVEGRQTIMGILPFFHVFGMTTVMNFGLSAGSLLILMPRFEVDRAVRLLDKHRVTVMPGVPTLFNAILNYPKIGAYDLSALRFCISGGAALPVEIKKKFEALTGAQVIEGYGLSETSPVVASNPVFGPDKPGSIGLPLPQTDISIRDIDDPSRVVDFGEKGEICVKGPQVMRGYWNKPEENAQSFIDGYFRTGDIGYMQADGYIYIVDRLKDMINASGFKIYPRQVEEALYAHPAVEEATVIGIPDDYRGEAPKAFVKLRQGQKISAEELLNFLKTRLSKIELPAEIEFRDELPKTLIGKLSKKELREDHQTASQKDAP